MDAPTTISFGHVPSFDGLRGIAVAAVVIYHFMPSVLPGGFIGVDVFFVLSGYLLTSLLMREQSVTGSIRIGTFVVRRTRRLLPAVLVLLTAVSIYAVRWADVIELARLRRHSISSLAYVANWAFISDGTTYTDVIVGASPLRHMWSLSIEEQFYLLLAGVLALVTILHRTSPKLRKRVIAGSISLVAVSAAWMFLLSARGANTDRLYFGSDTRAHCLLVGVALGAGLMGAPARPSRMTSRIAGGGAAVLVIVALTASEDATWMFRGGFLLTAMAAGAVVVCAPSSTLFRRLLEFRPLVALGVISYGVYLWHWPVLVIFDESRLGYGGARRTLTLFALTLAISTASYWLIERPIRHGDLGRRFGRPAVAIAPLATLAVGLALIAGTVVPSTLGNDAEAAPVSIAAPTPDSTIAESDPQVPPTSAEPDQLRIAVLGDSVMHTMIGGALTGFLDAVEWTPDQTSFDPQRIAIANATRPACSFLPGDIALRQPDGRFESASLEQFCIGWPDDLSTALGTASENKADALLVLLTIDLEDRRVDGEIVEYGTAEHMALLTDLLETVRRQAESTRTPVVLLIPAPRVDQETGRRDWERETEFGVFGRDYAAGHDDVTVIDLGDALCPELDCTQPLGGFDPEWRYDGLHFTTSGARWVATWLTPQLEALVGAA